MSGPGADVTPEALTYHAVVPPHGEWSATVSVVPTADGCRSGGAASFVRTTGELSPRDLRRQEWVSKIPVLQHGQPLHRADPPAQL